MGYTHKHVYTSMHAFIVIPKLKVTSHMTQVAAINTSQHLKTRENNII